MKTRLTNAEWADFKSAWGNCRQTDPAIASYIAYQDSKANNRHEWYSGDRLSDFSADVDMERYLDARDELQDEADRSEDVK